MSDAIDRREDGASILKTRHFWIGIVGLAFVVVPRVAQAFYSNGFSWAVVGAFAEKMGEALVIGAIVAYFLDVNLIRNVSKLLDRKVERIKQNVFEGVLGTLADKELFSVFDKTVLKCPLYRDQVQLNLTLTCESITVGGKTGNYLKCKWYERYVVHSLQSPRADHNLKISITTDDVKGLEYLCGVTKVMVDGVDKGREAISKLERHPGSTRS